MTTEPEKPKPRRRWLQYSLRTFFVLLTVLCVWLGWTVHLANEQRKAVEWVREKGGSVEYDYEHNPNPFSVVKGKPPVPKWLVQLLGVDYFGNVTGVDIGVPVEDSPVRDLTPLAGLQSLQELNLYSTQVNDLTPLANLTSLETLYVINTPVSEEQVEQLRKALPNCKIDWSPRLSAPSP